MGEVAVRGPRRPAGRDRLRRAHSPGPQRGWHRAGRGEREDRQRHGHVDPERDAEYPHLVYLSVLTEQRGRQKVPAHRPGDTAEKRRHGHQQHVAGHHLHRGEADRLQHADPGGPGDHRAADHVDHDEHRDRQRDHTEGDDEGHPRRDVALLGLPHAQVGRGVQQRPVRQRGPHRRDVGGDRGRRAGAREAIEHLRLPGTGRPAERGDLGRQHPGLRGVGDRVRDADDDQLLRTDREERPDVTERGPGHHDLPVVSGPVPPVQGEIVHRTAGGGPADDLQRSRIAARHPGHGQVGCHRDRGERPSRGGHAGQPGRGRDLRRRRHRGVHGRGDVRAVLGRERVVERAVRVGEHADSERRGGGGGQRHQADDHRLQPAPAQAAAGRAKDRGHGRATRSEATRPSASSMTRCAYRAASSGLWVTRISV